MHKKGLFGSFKDFFTGLSEESQYNFFHNFIIVFFAVASLLVVVFTYFLVFSF